MIEFKIDVTEIKALAKAVPEMQTVIADETDAAMNEAGMLLTGMVAARTPVNFGILRSSIQFPAGFEVRGTPGTNLVGTVQAGRVSMAGSSPWEYANYVEFGTRPHWPPIGPLKLWALRKFGDERMAYIVQQRIAFIGTEGHHMFKRAWEEGGQNRVNRIFAQVPARAVQKWTGMVS